VPNNDEEFLDGTDEPGVLVGKVLGGFDARSIRGGSSENKQVTIWFTHFSQNRL
jgi:hypothetical protein